MNRTAPYGHPANPRDDTYWFRELSSLLNFYNNWHGYQKSWAGGDVDTTEAPSRALAGYLVAAARRPGRAARALAEMTIIQENGLDDEAWAFMAEEGLRPDRFVTSDGKSPQQMIDLWALHLRNFIDGGEQIEELPPATHDEWRARLPHVDNLLGGYLHQNYTYVPETQTPDEAVDYFLSHQDPGDLVELLDEIADLRTLIADEELLHRAFNQMGCGVFPPRDLTYTTWLADIEQRAEARRLAVKDD